MNIKQFLKSDLMQEKGFRRILIVMGLLLILSGLLIGFHPASALSIYSYQVPSTQDWNYGGASWLYFDNETMFNNLTVMQLTQGINVSPVGEPGSLVRTGAFYVQDIYGNRMLEGAYIAVGTVGHEFSMTLEFSDNVRNYADHGQIYYETGGFNAELRSYYPITSHPANLQTSATATEVSGTYSWYFLGEQEYRPYVTPYPTPVYPGSCWDVNTTTWTNCSLPNGTWNLTPGTNLIPYMPWNITWINLTNRTNLTDLFNSSLIDITIVNKYLDINDTLFNNLRALIAAILNTLLYPVTWLAQQFAAFTTIFYTYVNGLLFYLKPVSFMFQIMIMILPPAFIYIGTVLLCLDFAWWVLYGRK